MNGINSLNYPSVYGLLDRMCLNDDEWMQTLDDIRVMESEVLKITHQETNK